MSYLLPQFSSKELLMQPVEEQIIKNVDKLL